MSDYLGLVEKYGNQFDVLNYWLSFQSEKEKGLRKLYKLIGAGDYNEFLSTPMKFWSSSKPNDGDVVAKFGLSREKSHDEQYSIEIEPKNILGYANGMVYVRHEPSMVEADPYNIARTFIKKTMKGKLSVGYTATLPDIRAWIHNRASAPKENLLVLDMRNRVLFDGVSGSDEETQIPEETKRLMRGGMIIHTHPQGTSLSAADILLAIKYDLKKILAVGYNDGRLVMYVLTRDPSGSWGDGMFEVVKKWMENLDNFGLPQNGIPPHYKMEDKRHIVNKILGDEIGLDYSARVSTLKGGAGSGNFGHRGIAGHHGGSAPRSGVSASKTKLGGGVYIVSTRDELNNKYDRVMGLPYVILPDETILGGPGGSVHPELMLELLSKNPRLIGVDPHEAKRIIGIKNGMVQDTELYDLISNKDMIRVRETSRLGEIGMETLGVDDRTLKRIKRLYNEGKFLSDPMRKIIWTDAFGTNYIATTFSEIMDANRVITSTSGESTLKEHVLVAQKGGKGSGFFSHAGRPGLAGGGARSGIINLGVSDRPSISSETMQVLNGIREAGGKPYIVGGYVRDLVMGYKPKDVDIEVYGLSVDKLRETLRKHGKIDEVGASFGIIKVSTGGDDLDVSIPRRENKAGQGHTGFIVELDPTLTPKEAASRRDFTMNSMFYDPFTGEIHDPYNGQGDIKRGIIRHTSEAYREDALRVLRGMQFAARFNMTMADETACVSQDMLAEYDTLAKERIYGEWDKWATKGKYPEKGLDVLTKTGWIDKYPELKSLIGVKQEPMYHPEGDCFVHTKEVVREASKIADREGMSGDERRILMFAALSHDLGKPSTTFVKDGRIISHGHAEMGVEPTISFLEKIGLSKENKSVADAVVPLVKAHLDHLNAINAKTVRRLAKRIEPANIRQLAFLIEADASGRGRLKKGMPQEAKLMLVLANQNKVVEGSAKAILMGRDLIQHGIVKPGPEMGRLLGRAYDAQMDGEFENLEGAIRWAEDHKEYSDSLKEIVTNLVTKLKGGAGSGNFGHAGIHGHQGGSAPRSGASAGNTLSASEIDKIVNEKIISLPYEETGKIDLSKKVVSVDSNGASHEVNKTHLSNIEYAASRLPKGSMDTVDKIVVPPTDEEFSKLFRQYLVKEGGKYSDNDAPFVDGFHINTGGEVRIYLRPRSIYDQSLIWHEVGHAVYDASDKKGHWAIAYRDPNFDRFTSYSRTNVRESFSETYKAFVSCGGEVRGYEGASISPHSKNVIDAFTLVDKVINGNMIMRRNKELDIDIKDGTATVKSQDVQTIVLNIPAPIVNITMPEQPAPVFNIPAPIVNITMPEQPTPVVNVAAPVVNVPAPVVRVPAPVVNVKAPIINIPKQDINIPAPIVNIENKPPDVIVNVNQESEPMNVSLKRDGNGKIIGFEENR